MSDLQQEYDFDPFFSRSLFALLACAQDSLRELQIRHSGRVSHWEVLWAVSATFAFSSTSTLIPRFLFGCDEEATQDFLILFAAIHSRAQAGAAAIPNSYRLKHFFESLTNPRNDLPPSGASNASTSTHPTQCDAINFLYFAAD